MFEMQEETLQRVRRIETRLTAWLVKQGEKVHGQEPPAWSAADECVVIPDFDYTLSACINTIPQNITGDVYIRTKDYRYIATIHVGGEK